MILQVKPTRAMAEAFDIRLNALDFKDLQDKVSRPIIVLQNITFHRTLLDRFIDTFKEEVNRNPFYDTAQVSNGAAIIEFIFKNYCLKFFIFKLIYLLIS